MLVMATPLSFEPPVQRIPGIIHRNCIHWATLLLLTLFASLSCLRKSNHKVVKCTGSKTDFSIKRQFISG